jgi:hypothetical protein
VGFGSLLGGKGLNKLSLIPLDGGSRVSEDKTHQEVGRQIPAQDVLVSPGGWKRIGSQREWMGGSEKMKVFVVDSVG